MTAGNSWPIVPLGDLLTDIQSGFASGRHNSDGVGVPHFRPMNVSTDGKIDRSAMKYVDPVLADRPERRLQRGDVLFNNTNSPELVGKTALFDGGDQPAFSNHMTRLRTDAAQLDPGYLAIWLHQYWREGWFAVHCNNHVSQASIGREVLKAFEIELPPIDVQRQIFELSRSVDGYRISSSDHLISARRAIEHFRQAVLAAACSGRLTADWRNCHGDVESGAQVLERIAESRTDDRRARMPVAVDAPNDDTEIPGSWAWAQFGSLIAELKNGVSPAPALEPPGIPILRISAARSGTVDLSDVRFLRSELDKWRLFLLRDGDLLFTRYNGSITLLGVCGMVRGIGDRQILYPDKLMRVRIGHRWLLPEYVETFFASPAARKRMTDLGVSSAGQQGISGASVKAQPIAVPPVEEQFEIIRSLGNLMAHANAISAAVEHATTLADQTSQAVLARAFSGELLAEPVAAQGGDCGR